MREVRLVTTNPGKVHSFERNLRPYDISVRPVRLELPEPQVTDLQIIARTKALHAYKEVGKPLIVQDTGFSLSAWNGFPGPFVKFAIQTLGVEGFIALVAGKSRECEFRECIAYYDGDRLRFFESSVPGSLSLEPQGVLPSFAWSELWRIFIPKGYAKTLAEMDEDDRNLWRKERGSTSTVKFAEWFVAHHNSKRH